MRACRVAAGMLADPVRRASGFATGPCTERYLSPDGRASTAFSSVRRLLPLPVSEGPKCPPESAFRRLVIE